MRPYRKPGNLRLEKPAQWVDNKLPHKLVLVIVRPWRVSRHICSVCLFWVSDVTTAPRMFTHFKVAILSSSRSGAVCRLSWTLRKSAGSNSSSGTLGAFSLGGGPKRKGNGEKVKKVELVEGHRRRRPRQQITSTMKEKRLVSMSTSRRSLVVTSGSAERHSVSR